MNKDPSEAGDRSGDAPTEISPPPGLSAEAGPLFDLWNAKRAGRAMPARRDLGPVELRPWLAQIMLLEVIEGGRDFRIRLLGTDAVQGVGVDVTGRMLSEIPAAPDLLVRFLAEYRAVVASARPGRALHDYVSPTSGRRIVFERLALPLSDDGTTVNMILALRRDLIGR
ncbi:PAS domain-containing protein [Desertibaculum subflavum]|uniref:PAS domain-containing protein n=1 Tax=Desertibaculum subflavum TaxID=2268458 RepID=UPI0013C48DA6